MSAQLLNSLVVSWSTAAQRMLEQIMHHNLDDYILTFVTYDVESLGQVDRHPDLVFIDCPEAEVYEHILQATARFPHKTYIVLAEAGEERRKTYISQGADEVMSLRELQSDVGRHLLEKLLAYKELAAAELRVEQSEERFRGIIEHSHDMILLLDAEATVVYVSPAFVRQAGYEPWEILGQNFCDYVHGDEQEEVRQNIERITNVWASDGISLSYRFRKKGDAWRNFETVATNLLNTEPVHAIVLNSRDVTDLKRTETALQNERDLVEQQRTFISMLSHEFRTPLTIIDGNAQIIQRRGPALEPAVLEKRAGTIRSAVDRLVQLIDTILSAHAIESGKLEPVMAQKSLGALIEQAVVEQRDISPDFDISYTPRDVPETMMLDEKLISQMMGNLLSNAVKYSPGSPRIDVSLCGYSDDNIVEIRVRDHGLGIPEAEIPRIFQKYFRATTSGGIPGSGLGLNLVKQFVELHNGSIGLSSSVGEGTEIIIKLPINGEAINDSLT